MRTYADNDVSMRVPSLLDQLSNEQMEELQSLMEAESESPTVSERLAQMTSKLSGHNKALQNVMKNKKAASADNFRDLITTPLYKLCEDDDYGIDNELEVA